MVDDYSSEGTKGEKVECYGKRFDICAKTLTPFQWEPHHIEEIYKNRNCWHQYQKKEHYTDHIQRACWKPCLLKGTETSKVLELALKGVNLTVDRTFDLDKWMAVFGVNIDPALCQQVRV